MPPRDDTHRAVDATKASMRLAKQMIFAAAFMSFAMSVYLFFGGQTDRGLYVGLWVPSILSAGNLLMTGNRHD